MEENAALILFSGIETHVSADEYAPFEANRNFFYLTGLRRERMILLMKKDETRSEGNLIYRRGGSDAGTLVWQEGDGR